MLLVMAIGAFVPAGCCWTQSMVGWLTGAARVEAGGDSCDACSHECESQVPDQPVPLPGHERECACGSQDRFFQPSTTIIPTPDAVVAAWIRPVGCVDSDRSAPAHAFWAAWGRAMPGPTTLLRLHCALIV